MRIVCAEWRSNVADYPPSPTTFCTLAAGAIKCFRNFLPKTRDYPTINARVEFNMRHWCRV